MARDETLRDGEHEPRTVLVVGAGAVGSVFGLSLSRAGWDVTFLVKPRHVPRLGTGIRLYPLNGSGGVASAEPIDWATFSLIDDPAAAAAKSWDQIHLCVSSPALHAGDWLETLLGASRDATVVLALPGVDDRAAVERLVGAQRIVRGVLALIAYHAPLPSEPDVPPGTAYWFPPMTRLPYSGAPERRDAVVSALSAGGMPVKAVDDVEASVAQSAMSMQAIIAALEVEGWSIKQLIRSDTYELALSAIRESSQAIGEIYGTQPLLHGPMLSPLVARPAGRLAAWASKAVMPFDLEVYLQEHFTKVAAQTTFNLARTADKAEQSGYEVPALRQLLDRLESAREG